MSTANFALYYAGDAYSTEAKIMGRQSAGKALMKGVARRWPTGEIHGFAPSRVGAQAMLKQLTDFGWKGGLRWRDAPGDDELDALGAVYYPSPVPVQMAHARNTRGTASYSLFGVTHTLSSMNAMDRMAEIAQAPFQSWDALICTSSVALSVVTHLGDEMRAWLTEHTGATKFSGAQLPVIPLGVDAPAFARDDWSIAEARQKLGLAPDEIAFLFAGRLTFHAKANPAVFYRALEAASQQVGGRLVCIEAGIHANEGTAAAFAAARAGLAPSARFIEIDGNDEAQYGRAWRAADVFVSLSDNIQETFGLTPVEAMAAGLPVLVSDWNGYKDTVRDGIDGYRVPTILPPDGTGSHLARRYALALDTYDYYIGRVSMATVVEFEPLTQRIVSLARSPDLRSALGAAGRQRATTEFDWPHILDRYVELAAHLGALREAGRATAPGPAPWLGRPDPFTLFGGFSTDRLEGGWRVGATGDAVALNSLLDLAMANYAFDASLPPDVVVEMHRRACEGEQPVHVLLVSVAAAPATRIRALMWLCKFGLLSLRR